jgi:hypothetical protein
VHHRETTQNHPIIDLDVTSELRVVGENRVVADQTVMSQMHIGHDPVVVADTGDGATRG